MTTTSNDQLTRFRLSDSLTSSAGTMSTNVGVADEHIESEDTPEHKSPGADTGCASQRLLLGVCHDGTAVKGPHLYRLLIPLLYPRLVDC
jgi:hypothetical protein